MSSPDGVKYLERDVRAETLKNCYTYCIFCGILDAKKETFVSDSNS
jgi:hypothetical protein